MHQLKLDNWLGEIICSLTLIRNKTAKAHFERQNQLDQKREQSYM